MMKKSFAFLVFLCTCVNVNCQILSGRIYDARDKTPINFASVYFSGTFTGTHSDQDGYFELDVSEFKSMPLTITALGYDQVSLNGFSFSKPVEINLKRRVFELEEVVVSGENLTRARRSNMQLFRSSFLGTTTNGLLSTIINEEDIHFKYDESDTLKAYASKPIQIENKGLGYTITYFLDKFEFYRNDSTFFFLGNIFFNEDLSTSGSLRQRYEKRRISAFKGSVMHFFRALWNDDLDSNGFWIKDSDGNTIGYSDIVKEDGMHNKYIWYPEMLVIHYKSKEPAGYINFRQNKVLFERSGFFDPVNIIWGGQMIRQRVGDWLPYDYSGTLK